MKVNLVCSARNIKENLFNESNVDWIGVDRGTFVLLNNDIIPVTAIGDFDSVSEKEREFIHERIEINPVNKEKDDTDLALAVNRAVELGYTQIEIHGATGGRLDHFMGAIQILNKPEFLEEDLNIRIIDQQNDIKIIKPGTYHITQIKGMEYISFIPIDQPIRMKLENFKYELPFTTLTQGSTLTISNEFKENKGSGVVKVELGNLLMIQSKD